MSNITIDLLTAKNAYVASCDVDLNMLTDKIEYYKTVVFTLEQILRSLNSRTWDLKTAVEWQKFTNGAF